MSSSGKGSCIAVVLRDTHRVLGSFHFKGCICTAVSHLSSYPLLVQAVFWATTATTGIGYDIIPVTNIEVFFTWVMIFCGLIVYSLVLGSAASALQNIDSETAHKQRTIERVTGYLRTRSIPRFFQKVVLDYYEHSMSSSREANAEEVVFKELPQSLRVRLMLLLNREMIQRIPIFASFNANLFIKMIQMLETITFLPGEFVITAGRTCRAIFFVDRGRVDVIERIGTADKVRVVVAVQL